MEYIEQNVIYVHNEGCKLDLLQLLLEIDNLKRNQKLSPFEWSIYINNSYHLSYPI